MTIAEFEALGLKVCLSALILYMFFIMYKLTKESKAGKFGGAIIFFVLGLGVFGFIIKEVAVAFYGQG